MSSQDILNFTLSLATIVATIFGGLFLYYMAMIMRQSFLIIKEMRGRFNSLDQFLSELKNKLSEGATSLGQFVNVLKTIFSWLQFFTTKKKVGKKIK